MDRVRNIAPLWQLAFRAGFLAAAIFGVLAMTRWLLWISRPQSWPAQIPPNWWHAHEMIFGFAMPVVAGFLLTAVATWTNLPGTRGWRLQLLFGLWLAARAVLWLAPQWLLLAWLAEMLFLLLLAYELGQRVFARRQWRNILFLPVLLTLLLLCCASYLSVAEPAVSTRLHYGAVWMISVFIVIIGGRVIPLFTANRLGLQLSSLPPWLEYLAIGSVTAVGLASAVGPATGYQSWLAALCLAASALHVYRLAHWQGWRTLRVPLLWSMHLSYACIPLALLGLAIAGGDPVADKNIIHLLAIGAIGGMILSMMSRVSLGHTGRPLEVPHYLAVAFALILLAAVIRSALPVLSATLSLLSWQISAVLWVVVFGMFLYRYLPILTRPRLDGRPG
ncbi:MAG: NnrS family protein [Halieaceae bacterium]|jgi:uncharacterized protein involved in response to NO|nr:NnrS family protein [Halieaceae bacterium]